MAHPLRLESMAVLAAVALLAGCDAEPAAHGDDARPSVTAGAAVDILEAPVPTDLAAAATPSTTASDETTATTATTAVSPARTTTTITTTTTAATAIPTTSTSTTTSTTVAPPPTTTSCTTVVHLGDSTSVGLFEPTFMPNPDDALPAQYERVGVQALYTEVSGGRSTIETIGGNENAFDTVIRLREMGYQGCWVVTIGTNDAANVAIGGVPDLSTRLDRMMVVFGSDPVLWVDAVTRVVDGPYADVNMQAWNAVLDGAEQRFPTLRVFRWSDVVLDEWFVTDGIHYTSGGSAWRSHAIADALVAAFPAGA